MAGPRTPISGAGGGNPSIPSSLARCGDAHAHLLPWPARKTEQAIERLAECLATPLQIEHYLTLALEQAYRFGEKLVTPEIIATVMAPDIEALESTLARQGYNVKTLAELLNIRPAEIRAFLQSRLPPGRAEELKQQLLGTGIPL